MNLEVNANEILQAKLDLAIVGGGLSGILSALKLSLLPQWKDKKIALIEEQPTLGGRLFFAQSHKSHQSGFGFEMYDLETKESLFRHIQNVLTEEEKNDFENYLANFHDEPATQSPNVCYFIKKEWTEFTNLLDSSSEILTKKEAEILRSIVNSVNIEKDSITEKESGIEKSPLWLALSKQSKESFVQIFETVIGSGWGGLPVSEIGRILKQNCLLEKNNSFFAFNRTVAIEFFLEKVLLRRRVEVKTLCKLLRLERINKEKFLLTLSNELNPEQKHLHAMKVILAIPLAKCVGLIPKEIFSPEQSKFTSKVQPRSLVVYEIPHFSNYKSLLVSEKLKSFDKLVFPVERVMGFYASDDRLIFYTELDYESSMQAPAVREAISLCKKAAARILKEEVALEIKKGIRMPQAQIIDRVILLPVAYTFSAWAKLNFELKQPQMGVPNLYCCGDSMFSLASEPWKRVIHSVQDTTYHLIDA